MTDKVEKRIDNLKGRIAAAEEMSDADREVLKHFNDRLVLLSSEYSDQRREHLLRRLVIMAEEVGGLADALEDREAAEDIVRWIHGTYDNEETNRDYRGTLRVFGKRASEEEGIPDSLSWVSGSTSKNYKPRPNPADMLRWEQDIQPMLEAAKHSRGEAMIALAWDSGVRSGEFQDLTVGDVSDHKRGLRISVDGKTGQRSVTLIPSVPYVQRWLSDHPGGDPDDPLWSKLKTPEETVYNNLRHILRRAAKNAGVQKPVTITNFRKSSASYLASQGVTQAVLEEHHGWERGSRVAARYVSVFQEATDREIAAAHGQEVEPGDEPDPTAPVECPRCERDTPRERDFCIHCSQALDFETQQLVDDVAEMIDNHVVLADDPDRREDLLRARRTLQEKPALMDPDELHDLASGLSSDD